MRIGIDFGGTKIEGIALAPDGVELARERIATPRDDYGQCLDAVVAMVARIEAPFAKPGSASVGVGIPGTPSPRTGLIKNANSTWLNGRPLAADLTARLGRPVRLANDANCLAVSEATDGAGAGAHTVFAAILGTGVGAGIAVAGRAVTGRTALVCEWGHMPLPWMTAEEYPGSPCYCGRRGCVETWCSGPGISADHARAGGGTLTVQAIADGAAAGDSACRATLARFHDRLARALGIVISLVDPDVIVLGGGVSNLAGLPEILAERLPAQVFGGEADTPVRRARHGDSSGVRGAAWLWPAASA
ncbi:MAG: ROK family protein [Rhodospirillaceae bacterium]|nr:ROK family protein [Rhodospirillaceae bacterium]MCA8932373.1 ROK family protein [Rhodospirillaceae bacterium]